MHPGIKLKKITVIGPGSLGILFATRIWQRFKNLSLLDYKRDRANRLTLSGLSLIRGSGEEMVAFPRVSSDPSELGIQDFVLVLVKAFQTKDIVDALQFLCGPETLVVSLQNGLGAGDAVARKIPQENLALGVTMEGANKKDERTAIHAGSGLTVLGKYLPGTGEDERLLEFAEILEQSGFSCEVVDDIYPVIWKKLLVNVGINPITAISGLKNGQILNYPELLNIQEMAVKEGFDVMEGHGIRLHMDFQQLLAFVRKVCQDTSENVSSMLQDRLRGGKTEVEYINGAIVRKAREIGLSAPVNDTLCKLVEFFSQLGLAKEVEKS